MRIMHVVYSYCLDLLPGKSKTFEIFGLMLTDNTATLASHYKLNLLDDRQRLNEDNEESEEALVANFKHQGIEEAKALLQQQI